MALPISVEEKRKGAARALPPPLYVTYTQLAAAREAFDDDFEVHIEGSVADAEALQRKAAAAEEAPASGHEEAVAVGQSTSFGSAIKTHNPDLITTCNTFEDYKTLRNALEEHGVETFKQTETVMTVMGEKKLFSGDKLNINGIMIYDDYGISWDEYFHRISGFVSLNYFRELF